MFRSKSDAKLLINRDQAVITITANRSFPFKATMFLETIKNKTTINFDEKLEADSEIEYGVFQINHISEKEYESLLSPYYKDIYTIYGPGIRCRSSSAHSLSLEDKMCLIMPVPRNQAIALWNSESLSSSRNNPFLNMDPIDFMSHLLVENSILPNKQAFNLFYIPEKSFHPTDKAVTVWKINMGESLNPPVNSKKESEFVSELLSGIIPNQNNLTSGLYLNSLFKESQEGRLRINWNSDFGKDIQFIQQRLGLFVFCYENFLKDSLLNHTLISPVLFGLILDFIDNEYNRKSNVLTPQEPQRNSYKCLIM